MSNWGYIGMAYGLAYIALAGYALYLRNVCKDAEHLSNEEVR